MNKEDRIGSSINKLDNDISKDSPQEFGDDFIDTPPDGEMLARDLIRHIVCYDDDFHKLTAKEKLIDVANDDRYSIAYSLIFDLLLSAGAKMGELSEAALCHCRFLSEMDEIDDRSRKVLSKIKENIRLSLSQIRRIESLGEDLSKAVQMEVSNFTKELEARNKKVDEDLNQHRRSIMSQIVGAISVFTALAFILFGGISGISSLSDVISLGKKDFTTMLICFLLFALIMLGCICLFIYFVLQIINKNEGGIPLRRVTLWVVCPIAATILILFIIHCVSLNRIRWFPF